MSEWRPIETAPKDGTAILGYDPAGVESENYYWPQGHKHHVVVMRWKVPDQQSQDGPTWATTLSYYSFGPYDDPSAEWVGVECSPTHWMPLPEPPK